MALLPIIAVVIVFVFGVALIIRSADSRREGAYRQAAAELGIEYVGGGSTPLNALMGQLPMLSKGRGHRLKNVMRAEIADVPAYLAEFHYKTGGGQGAHHHHNVFLAAFNAGVDRVPDFRVRAEHALKHRIAEAFGHRDIDFREDPAFSDAYVLQASNEASARAYFDHRRRAHLTDLDPRPTIESHGGWVVVMLDRPKPVNARTVTASIEHAFAVCGPLL